MFFLMRNSLLLLSAFIFFPFSSLAYTSTSVENLSRISYLVTQEGATEKPFENIYWDNYEAGIYVDIIDGTPLFLSKDKYVSDTWWPTFSRPIRTKTLQYREDTSSWEERIEVVSQRSVAHLGHLFDDGPIEYAGIRYCINSASIRFVAKSDMKKEGYGAFLRLLR